MAIHIGYEKSGYLKNDNAAVNRRFKPGFVTANSRIKENIYLCIHADLDTVCCPISISLRVGEANQQEDCR